jgi:hypothetical protein
MNWTKIYVYDYCRDWEEFFVKETMAPYLTTSRGHFKLVTDHNFG